MQLNGSGNQRNCDFMAAHLAGDDTEQMEGVSMCRLPTKAICCRIFTPALPDYPAASVRDFLSGAYRRGLLPAPLTDPDVRLSRIRLLPRSAARRAVGSHAHARVTVGTGSGKSASSRLNRAQVMPWFWLLRVSTRYQSFRISMAKLAIDRMLLGSP